MKEKRTAIAVVEAVEKVMQFAKSGSNEKVSLHEAFGRYLGEDLVANQDLPIFDRSPYDGYAIRAQDTTNSPSTLEVVGDIHAGMLFPNEVDCMQAVRVMTGAQIPRGCNAVVMVELVKEYEENGKKYIQINRSFQKGDNIAFQGEEVKKGTLLATKGTYINPGIIALLATFGYAEVAVAKQPIVGLYAVGTDLLDVNDPLEAGKIRDSNTYMILSQIQRLGAKVKYFGRRESEVDVNINFFQKALSEVDIFITTGGVSVGEYDLLPKTYEQLGANVLFNKVAMRPGSVTTAAIVNDKLLFGLSGNPSACYVGFELFVRPVIKAFMGSLKPHLKKEKAMLMKDFLKANPFLRFVRARIANQDEKRIVFPTGFDKSSSVASLCEANALIVFPGGTKGYRKESIVDILLLEDSEGSEWPWNDLFPLYK